VASTPGTSHGLGFGHGSLIEYSDGTVEYRRTGTIMPAFKVRVVDVIGFSVRRATRDDKQRLEATFLQQVLTVQGSGTTLAEVAINLGTAEKIEEWFRAHPEFGRVMSSPARPAPVVRFIDAAADARRVIELLGGQVFNLVGSDESSKQALADASERFTAASSQIDQATTSEQAILARKSAEEGLYYVRAARIAMGLDPGPELELAGTQASDAPVSEGGRVQVGDRETGASHAPGPQHAPVSIADELIKLAQLRDAGVLTPEEFQAQKAKLLG
jgi:hypothetical protein